MKARRKRKSEEEKEKHNKISRKGRQKINDQINLLKTLLPECKSVECNKAIILQNAVKAIEKYQYCYKYLMQYNQMLENENAKLSMLISKLSINHIPSQTQFDESHVCEDNPNNMKDQGYNIVYGQEEVNPISTQNPHTMEEGQIEMYLPQEIVYSEIYKIEERGQDLNR